MSRLNAATLESESMPACARTVGTSILRLMFTSDDPARSSNIVNLKQRTGALGPKKSCVPFLER